MYVVKFLENMVLFTTYHFDDISIKIAKFYIYVWN